MTAYANLFGPDVLIIIAIIAVIFGGSKLPELGRGLGQGMKEFRDAMHAATDVEKSEDKKAS